METKHAFFDKKYWSNNKYAWIFAVLILSLVIIFGALLKAFGVYESMWLRSMNIVIILFVFLLMIRVYGRAKKRRLTFFEDIRLLIRTGFYFCLLFFPMLLFFISEYPNELQQVERNETFNSDFPAIQIAFSTYIETIAAVVVCALAVAFTRNFGRKRINGR